jgi:hypothetical protein
MQVEVSLDEVNTIIREMVRNRLYILDDIIKKARWSWLDVDILMFTGQTCHAPAIRDVILEHVSKKRKNSMPILVVPPSMGSYEPPEQKYQVEKLIKFDPKICVPGGAAIQGYSGRANNKIHLVLAPHSTISVDAEEDGQIRKGDPLPAFIAILPVDNGKGGLVSFYIEKNKYVIEVPSVPDDAFISLLVDKESVVHLLVSGEEEDTMGDIPEAIANAIGDLPKDFYQTAGLRSSVITWFQTIPPPYQSTIR